MTATRAPSRARRSAIALPIPRPPPVTSATRFDSAASTGCRLAAVNPEGEAKTSAQREPEESDGQSLGARSRSPARTIRSLMAARIIDGKAVAARVREQVSRDVERFERETGVRPGLATVLVGEDPASA